MGGATALAERPTVAAPTRSSPRATASSPIFTPATPTYLDESLDTSLGTYAPYATYDSMLDASYSTVDQGGYCGTDDLYHPGGAAAYDPSGMAGPRTPAEAPPPPPPPRPRPVPAVGAPAGAGNT